MKFFRQLAKRILFWGVWVSIIILSGMGCSAQPPSELPIVTAEHLTELEENIGVQLLKYYLKLNDKDISILAPYLKTKISSSHNGSINTSVECVCSSPHFSVYVVSFEQVEGSFIDNYKYVPDYSFMYMADEEGYFGSRSKTFDTAAGELPWPDDWGKAPENIRYMYFTVKNGPLVKYSFLDVDSLKYSPDDSVPASSMSIRSSLILENMERTVLSSSKTRNSFENVSVSPFYIWADYSSDMEQSPLYDVYLQYKDGTKIGYTSENFKNQHDLEGNELPWHYHDSISELYIQIDPPYLELDKIDSVIINGAKFPLKYGRKPQLSTS